VRIGNLRRPKTLQWVNRFMYAGARNLPVHAANRNLCRLRRQPQWPQATVSAASPEGGAFHPSTGASAGLQ
jgi:hypothetical protein